MGILAQMPLPDVGRPIAVLFQRLGERDFLERQVLVNLRILQLLKREFTTTGQPVGEVQPSRILAGHDARASWRAHMAGGISLSEPHSLPRQPVNVWRLVKAAPEAAHIPPTEVIDEKENDVRRPISRASSRGEQNCECQHRDKLAGDNSLHKTPNV